MIVMPRNANPARVAGCKDLGVEVVLVDDGSDAVQEPPHSGRQRRAHTLEALAQPELDLPRVDRLELRDRLLEAFARSGFGGDLVIVGTGTSEQRRRLRESISERGLEARVDLPGFQANPYPIIRHARGLVLTSDYEGFGNVIVESLVCGTPVVSTRCPSGPDEILTGELARGLADLDADSLAEAIDRVLADPPMISEASVQRFAIEAVAERYLALAD